MTAGVRTGAPNLALVAMHGPPEATGQALLESHEENPIEGWDFMAVDEQALAAGVRSGPSGNVASSFRGSRRSKIYSTRRAAQALDACQGRHTVLNIHDRPDATGEYVLAGGVHLTRLIRIAGALGIQNVLTDPPNMIGHHQHNVLTVELCRDDEGDPGARLAHNVQQLRRVMHAITAYQLPPVDSGQFDYYHYGTEIHDSEVERLGIDRSKIIRPFEPIPSETTERLGLGSNNNGLFVAESWNGINSSKGVWFGGILRKIAAPTELDGRPTTRAHGLDIRSINYIRGSKRRRSNR